MPRYFSSLIPTGRPLMVADRSFVFEPVEPMGGSWLGVLAVDDESAASHLAANGIGEISAERYAELKKKQAGGQTTHGYVPSRTPQLPPQPLERTASPAVRPSGSASEDGGGTPDDGAKPVGSVMLLTTNKQPPVEPLLTRGEPARRKAA